MILAGTLAAKKSVRCYLYFPAWKIATEQYLDLSGGAQWFDRSKVYWDRDFRPRHASRFARRVSQQRHPGLAVPLHVGRPQRGSRPAGCRLDQRQSYGCLDSESQAILRGMDLMGHADFARRGLEYWQSRVNPQGFFVNYSLSGVGETLWTLAEHFGRTRDRDWLKKVAPTVVRSCKWIAPSSASRWSPTPRANGYGVGPDAAGRLGRLGRPGVSLFQRCPVLRRPATGRCRLGGNRAPRRPALEEDARQYRETFPAASIAGTRSGRRSCRWPTARGSAAVLPCTAVSASWTTAFPARTVGGAGATASKWAHITWPCSACWTRNPAT